MCKSVDKKATGTCAICKVNTQITKNAAKSTLFSADFTAFIVLEPSYLFSLLEYINTIRVEKIKELLKEGMSIVEICPQAGFRNSGALIRVFKKETGITPGQMKKLNK